MFLLFLLDLLLFRCNLFIHIISVFNFRASTFLNFSQFNLIYVFNIIFIFNLFNSFS